MRGNLVQYHQLRNRTQRMAIKLRKNYFVAKVEQLHSSDPHQWWTRTKRLLNIQDSDPLASLIECKGSPEVVVEAINEFFVSVSAHLPKVDPIILDDLADDYSAEFVIDPVEVESRLARINIHKAAGPDDLLRDYYVTLRPISLNHWRLFLMLLSVLVIYHRFGNQLKYRSSPAPDLCRPT